MASALDLASALVAFLSSTAALSEFFPGARAFPGRPSLPEVGSVLLPFPRKIQMFPCPRSPSGATPALDLDDIPPALPLCTQQLPQGWASSSTDPASQDTLRGPLAGSLHGGNQPGRGLAPGFGKPLFSLHRKGVEKSRVL